MQHQPSSVAPSDGRNEQRKRGVEEHQRDVAHRAFGALRPDQAHRVPGPIGDEQAQPDARARGQAQPRESQRDDQEERPPDRDRDLVGDDGIEPAVAHPEVGHERDREEPGDDRSGVERQADAQRAGAPGGADRTLHQRLRSRRRPMATPAANTALTTSSTGSRPPRPSSLPKIERATEAVTLRSAPATTCTVGAGVGAGRGPPRAGDQRFGRGGGGALSPPDGDERVWCEAVRRSGFPRQRAQRRRGRRSRHLRALTRQSAEGPRSGPTGRARVARAPRGSSPGRRRTRSGRPPGTGSSPGRRG